MVGRGLLEGIEDEPEDSGDESVPAGELIEAGEDAPVNYNPAGQDRKKPAKAPPTVDPNVGGEPVAKGVGQVVDERVVTEVVFSPPEDSVGFEGPEAVGHEDNQVPAGPQDPPRLSKDPPVVVHVLEDLMQQDNIEGGVPERKVFADGLNNGRRNLPGKNRPVPVDLDPDDVGREL